MARRRLDPCLRNARKGGKIFGSIIGTGLKMMTSANKKNSNSGCAINLIFAVFLITCISVLITSCNNNLSKDGNNNNQTAIVIDSLQLEQNKIDSVINSGGLTHFESYKIGKVKNIFINVNKMVINNKDTLICINLKKDCGNDYFYSWENKMILPGEVKYYIQALNEMQNNIDRKVDHEEKYMYITKSELITLLINENNNKGWIFIIKFRNDDNSIEYLSNKDIENLKLLLEKCKSKINEIK